MTNYPLDAGSRAEIRADLRRVALAKAERLAASAGRSLNCRERTVHGTHPADGPGCTNDGTGCLCLCHDQP